MEVVMSVVVGLMFSISVYLLLHRGFVSLLLGVVMLGNSANIFIFTAGRLVREEAPVISENLVHPEGAFADPLPQALILTALVIGFGVQAFAFVLIKRSQEVLDTADLDDLQ